MVKLANTETAAQKKATRAAYGATLAELAAEGVPVVAVDADLTGSTTTKKLADAGYAGRLFNCGIAEQNMIDVAAGLSLAGNIAFTGSFAVFGTGRAYDQIRNTVCYSNLNVKIAPTHAGISVGPDGGSHQMLEDVSLMRGLPGMRVLVPADYAAARAALRLAAATPGPVYVRMAAPPCPASTTTRWSWKSVAPTCCARGAMSPSWPTAWRSARRSPPPTRWPPTASPPRSSTHSR